MTGNRGHGEIFQFHVLKFQSLKVEHKTIVQRLIDRILFRSRRTSINKQMEWESRPWRYIFQRHHIPHVRLTSEWQFFDECWIWELDNALLYWVNNLSPHFLLRFEAKTVGERKRGSSVVASSNFFRPLDILSHARQWLHAAARRSLHLNAAIVTPPPPPRPS